MKKIFALTISALPLLASATTPLWLRDVQISPDGKEIAFAYKGDIWKVASTGGEAKRLTTRPSYEANPIWSPDGKTIAFSSDRHGNADIFVMPASGGAPQRLTVNSANETPEAFSPDGKYVIYSAAIQDPAQSAMFPSSRLTELYRVPVKGGAMEQILGTPALNIDYMPDGKSFVYTDQKGVENEWRKHHTSSVTRDVWLYDAATGKHTNLTAHPGEDRNAVVAGADDFYFLSERDGGSMNVYRAAFSNPSSPKAVTTFKSHPVRFLSRSGNGTLCYTYDGEIYTQQPGGKPSKVGITITDDDTADTKKLSVGSPTEFAISPDGKSIAFIWRGEVFVTSADYKTTKQITHTPAAEKHLEWGHDSKSLIYTSERDGKYNIYQAKMGRADDPNFANATVIEEKPLFKADGHERTVPMMSPDGKKLGFILDRNKLGVLDLATKKVTMLTDGSTYRHRSGGFDYRWSPDSKWIALEVIDHRDPYSDIAIINVADGKMTNITQSGYFDEAPSWVLDGNALLFRSECYGMRNHASWGSMYDAMLVFLNQEAYDKYMLNKEDKELADEAEKAAEKAAKKDGDDKDKPKDKKKEVKDINVELDGIDRRIVRVTPFSTDMSDATVTSDGANLFFISAGDGNNLLWKMDLKEGKVEMSKTIPSTLKKFASSADGKTMYVYGSTIQKFVPSTSKLTPVSYSATMLLDPAAEREYMFDNIVREEQERFYDKGMHGVDWAALTKHYRKFLPHINNNYDFAEMASELLGELNVSHTGCGYRPSISGADRTARLGLLYDLTYTGKGLKIAEVVEHGPFNNAASKARAGVIVEKINGEEITHDKDYTTMLTDIAGKKTLVSLYDPTSGDRWDEVVKPITPGAMSDLLYDRWVKARAADVDRWSNGRLGYVHIEAMNDKAFRPVYSELMGKYADRDGVVIDIRYNGGGRMHEDIEVLLSGEKYLTQEIRGERTCDMPSRRWNKPSIMLINEACYSNAHGTPWVYNNRKIGKLVGMPVAGTMTSVNWVTMLDPSMYFGIPVIGYRTAEGYFLENHQLEPDVKVANDPATIVNGEDTQLRTAVETLLKELK